MEELREQIDKIDNEIVELFVKRMGLTEKVGQEKLKKSIRTEDSSRENEILKRLEYRSPEELQAAVKSLYRQIFKISKYYQDLEGKTFGLVGSGLGHSLSPMIHKNFAYDYKIIDLDQEGFEKFMGEKNFTGINVTIPYKIQAMAYADYIDPLAKKIGSVNTLVNRDGKIFAYNTDYQGLAYTMERSGISIKDKKVLILGTGGSSKTATALAQDQGADSIRYISRKGPYSYDSLEESSDYQVIINASPIGMYPNNLESRLNLSIFHRLEAVVDLVYNPLKTKLILDAESLEIPYATGLDMLVSQAFFASQHFTGYSLDEGLIQEISNNLRSSMTSIALIGMPGSGKSSLARILAKRTGRSLVDTDQKIEEMTGMSCSNFIKIHGEKAFRDAEEEIINKYGKDQGIIIATGGGSVIRKKNRDALRQNSLVFLLDRRLDKLPLDGRPLSLSSSLEDLYEQRKDIYKKCQDLTIQVIEGDLEGTADLIMKGFLDETTGN